MAITAAMVKELREMTGAGMMDCKKALNETNGNMDEAVEFLRKNGQARRKLTVLQQRDFVRHLLLTMLRTQLLLRLTLRQTSLLRMRHSRAS